MTTAEPSADAAGREVLRLVADRAEALARQDWDVVAAQLHPAFAYTGSRGDRLDRAAYLDFLRSGPLRWTRQRLEHPVVAVTGGTAVLTAVVVDEVTVDGQAHVLRFATTQTYVRSGGRWCYLAGHTSAPVE